MCLQFTLCEWNGKIKHCECFSDLFWESFYLIWAIRNSILMAHSVLILTKWFNWRENNPILPCMLPVCKAVSAIPSTGIAKTWPFSISKLTFPWGIQEQSTHPRTSVLLTFMIYRFSPLSCQGHVSVLWFLFHWTSTLAPQHARRRLDDRDTPSRYFTCMWRPETWIVS